MLCHAGAGIAMTMPAATAVVLEAAPGSQAGIAASTVNAARQVGGMVGAALLGTVVQAGARASAVGAHAGRGAGRFRVPGRRRPRGWVPAAGRPGACS
jgi:DHA2 family methylenomycin A resistance protein-like MFS transporter